MEEMSLKYVKIIVGFVIVISLSTFTLKNHLKSVTNAKKTAEVIQNLDETAQKEMMQALQNQENPEIKQVQVSPEASAIQQQETSQRELTEEEKAAIEASMNRRSQYEEEGLRKMGEGDLDSAILNFEKVLEEGDEKSKPRVSKYLAQCYEQKGDIPGMINTYNRILPMMQNPYEKREINEKLANCFLRVGNNEQALKYYEENYSMTPMASDIVNIGEILMQTGDREKMKSYLDIHLSQFPDDSAMLQKYSDWVNSDY